MDLKKLRNTFGVGSGSVTIIKAPTVPKPAATIAKEVKQPTHN